jgi:hypothetical protein
MAEYVVVGSSRRPRARHLWAHTHTLDGRAQALCGEVAPRGGWQILRWLPATDAGCKSCKTAAGRTNGATQA